MHDDAHPTHKQFNNVNIIRWVDNLKVQLQAVVITYVEWIVINNMTIHIPIHNIIYTDVDI